MRLSSPPLPRSLPFLCPHVFIRVCIRLRGRRQKERDRRWGEEGEGNSLFSPSPSPTLSLFVPATNTRYLFMKRLSKPCYTSFTFSIGLSLGKLILPPPPPPPPPPPTHTHTLPNPISEEPFNIEWNPSSRNFQRAIAHSRTLGRIATAFGRSDFLDSLGDQGVVIIMGWLV